MSYDNEWNRERPRRSRRRQTGQERKREREQQEDHGPELDISLGRREPLPEPEPLKPASRVSRAREKQQKKRKKHKLILIAVEVLVFLGIVAFLIYSYLKSSMDLIQRLPFDEQQVMNLELTEEKQEQMKGYWTIAVFGVDDRGTVIGKGTHADVNIICNINQDTGEIKLVSVYRDTYLNINDKNSYNKINQAYFDGGPEQAVRALNRNLDLNMTDYVTFNWKAVADAINILGGVDLELSKAEFYYINAFITETVEATGIPSKHLTHAGMNHLDGVQAVAYGRLRLMDTDFARTERQRKVINLAFEKAKKADWATLNAIIQTVFPNLATNVEMSEVVDLAWDINKLHMSETSGFPTARSDARMGSKGACVIPQTLESNVVLLHQFLFGDENYNPTDAVKTISAKISADSGLYKAGTPQGDKGTGGGVIPKETTAAETPEAAESTPEGETREPETDENGNPVETTEGISMAPEETADGVRPGGDASGWEAWETDEHGNLVDPAWGSTGGNHNNAATSTEDLYPTPGGGSTQTPGGSQSYPGSSPTTPGGSSQTPGGNQGTYPTTGNGSYQTPGGSQSYPGSGQTSPGGNSQTPGSGNYQTPGGSQSTYPTTGSGSYQTPGGSQSYPGSSQTSPGGSYQTPGSSSQTPGSGNTGYQTPGNSGPQPFSPG